MSRHGLVRAMVGEALSAKAAEAGATLVVWSITRRDDQPGPFQATCWEVHGDGTTRATAKAIGRSLEQVRLAIPQGLARLPAHPLDDASIVESWA